MSETTTVPFEAASAPTATPIAEPAAAGNRNRLLALGGAAAVVLLGVLAYFLLFAGGGSDEAASAAPPKHVIPADPGQPAPVVPATQTRQNAKSFGRDPFKALIAPADPVGAVGGAGSTTTPVVSGSPTTGGATTTGGTTTGSTPVIGGSGSTTTGGSAGSVGAVTPVVTADHTFRVVGVSADGKRITVRVDGKSYSGLQAGQVFATYFKVIVIGGQVNGFQFGDEKFSVFGTKKLHIAA
jgi:hypothetical protein